MRDEQERIRERLRTELAQTDMAIAEATHSAATVMLDQASVGRVSRADAMQQQAIAQGLLGRLRIRGRKLRAALERLDAGGYGRCCECGVELDPDRLAADAAAIFCAGCAAAREAQ